MRAERNGIKVFVSSTVHEVQNDLDHVYALLDSYGYDVMLSHKGTDYKTDVVESLDRELIMAVQQKAKENGRLKESMNGDAETFLTGMQLVNLESVTNGAMALFGKEAGRVLPQCAVKYRLYRKYTD